MKIAVAKRKSNPVPKPRVRGFARHGEKISKKGAGRSIKLASSDRWASSSDLPDRNSHAAGWLSGQAGDRIEKNADIVIKVRRPDSFRSLYAQLQSARAGSSPSWTPTAYDAAPKANGRMRPGKNRHSPMELMPRITRAPRVDGRAPFEPSPFSAGLSPRRDPRAGGRHSSARAFPMMMTPPRAPFPARQRGVR